LTKNLFLYSNLTSDKCKKNNCIDETAEKGIADFAELYTIPYKLACSKTITQKNFSFPSTQNKNEKGLNYNY